VSTLNQTYKELAIPFFKEVFGIIDEVLTKHDIPYYLIGASAVALELLKKDIKPSRGTKDIDFALMVSSIEEYNNIIASLEEKGFKKVKAPWTVYSNEFNIAIDLLPYGEIEEHDAIQFNERYSDLHVLGFKEVLEESVDVHIDESIAQIPPIEGMVVLKLVAWSDRPEERDTDLTDILRIIEHYFDIKFDEIVEHHNDTFPEGELDQILVAARVLGRNSKNYIQKSERLKERVFKVMEENIKDELTSAIAKGWARKKDWEVKYAKQVIEEFYKGLND